MDFIQNFSSESDNNLLKADISLSEPVCSLSESDSSLYDSDCNESIEDSTANLLNMELLPILEQLVPVEGLQGLYS